MELPGITNAHTKATTYITQNQSDASISFPVTTDQYQIEIAADALKASNVEIYNIVALSVCGGIDTLVLTNSCNGIGNFGASYPDSTQDHRLLKCIASNTPGTNDHYYETATAAGLPGIFNSIAQAIAFRLVE